MSVDHGFGVPADDFDEHHVACLALYQRRDLAVAATEEQVTLPMARHGPIFDGSWPFADRYRIRDSSVVVGLLCVMARAPHAPRPPQVLQQLLPQSPASLNEGASVDRLVGHAMALIAGVGSLQPSRNLLWRPLHLELGGDDFGQSAILDQLAALLAMRPNCSGLVGQRRSVTSSATVALDLTSDG